MARKRTLLFLQLPQLDTEVRGPHENVPLAAHYLRHAAARAGELEHYEVVTLPRGTEDADNRSLVSALAALAPDVVAATLYLWNVERTLRILAALRRRRPRTRVAAGGPELARPHPFAFRPRVLEAAAVGEGEGVFPAILRRFRGATAPHYDSVALLDGSRYAWGRAPAPAVDLAHALPPPSDPAWQPDARGMVYLETSRGCPLRCTYCRYHHLRRGVSYLAPRDVARRVEALRGRGAREVRFVDPTFNAHPQFDAVLDALRDANRDRSLAFFAELRADPLTVAQVDRLALAGFTDVEVGLQSRDPTVLRTIQRPTRLDRLDTNVRRLGRRGVRVTLDVMYGLPGQAVGDVRASLRWAARQPNTNVQCLQTLLLPGTDLRAQRRRWGMTALPLPPYAVTATASMPAADMAAVERRLARDAALPADIRTRRFVGRTLPDLFPERVTLTVPMGLDGPPPGTSARRAVVLRGGDLWPYAYRLADWVTRAVGAEPDMLWQFVVAPRAEEPLDLLDALVAAIRRAPPHIADRYASARTAGLLVSRRVFVRLPRRRIDPSWVRAAEALLAAAFF